MAKTASQKRTVELSADELNLLRASVSLWLSKQRAESKILDVPTLRALNGLLGKLGYGVVQAIDERRNF
jgi:hypothetical protein